MSYNIWVTEFDKIIDQIKSRNFVNHMVPTIKHFVKKFCKTFDIIKIDNDELNKSLDNIGGFNRLIISFDIEFQSMIVPKTNNYISFPTIFKNNAASFVKEFGLIMFIRDDKRNWFYIGHIFVNFPGLTTFDINLSHTRYFPSLYATVSDKTKELMEQNDKYFYLDYSIDMFELYDTSQNYLNLVNKIEQIFQQSDLVNEFIDDKNRKLLFEIINKIKKSYPDNINYIKHAITELKKIIKDVPFNIYGKYIDNNKLKKIFYNQSKLYWNDPLVKSRLIDKKSAKMFLDMFNTLSDNTYYIVKGKRDIEALNNTFMLLHDSKKSDMDLKYIYDIEIFNQLSNRFFGGAKLEMTYEGMTNSPIYKHTSQTFFNKLTHIIGETAHNPVTDSLFTVIVAVTINLILNSYFATFDKYMYGSGDKDYEYKYKKYKEKYLSVKNKSN